MRWPDLDASLAMVHVDALEVSEDGVEELFRGKGSELILHALGDQVQQGVGQVGVESSLVRQSLAQLFDVSLLLCQCLFHSHTFPLCCAELLHDGVCFTDLGVAGVDVGAGVPHQLIQVLIAGLQHGLQLSDPGLGLVPKLLCALRLLQHHRVGARKPGPDVVDRGANRPEARFKLWHGWQPFPKLVCEAYIPLEASTHLSKSVQTVPKMDQEIPHATLQVWAHISRVVSTFEVPVPKQTHAVDPVLLRLDDDL
mmetsp:Transcript_22638/g.40634  ORF Transcript_22638/g.40634 Transcript_22638/m.40634 type:complete len:254 (+) Transcript_22638:1516-2277(+)